MRGRLACSKLYLNASAPNSPTSRVHTTAESHHAALRDHYPTLRDIQDNDRKRLAKEPVHASSYSHLLHSMIPGSTPFRVLKTIKMQCTANIQNFSKKFAVCCKFYPFLYIFCRALHFSLNIDWENLSNFLNEGTGNIGCRDQADA